MPTLINRSINLDQSKRFVDTIFLTQGEGGATTLNFVLMQSGAVIDLTGCAVNFLAKKPSGATLTNACTLTNAALGKVAYIVTTQTAIEAGNLIDARLSVVKSGVLWRTFKFNATVEAVPDYSTAIQSTNEFSALQSAIATAQGLDAAAVHKAGDETLTGLKSVPTPTADAHIANKAYVDGQTTSGSNSRGSWVKYSDGTMIQYSSSIRLDFLGASACRGDWTFPLNFYSGPVADPTLVGNTSAPSADMLGSLRCGSTDTTKATFIQYRAYGQTSFVSGNFCTVSAVAHGRWKA